MKNEINTPIRNKRHQAGHRWLWMSSAVAATGAALPSAHAVEVTVNLTGNYISTTGGDTLSPDLLNDGVPIIAFTHRSITNKGTSYVRAAVGWSTVLNLHTFKLRAYDLRTGVVIGTSNTYGKSLDATNAQSWPIHFSDPNINGGAPTVGTLDVSVLSSPTEASITFDSFTYVSSASVPDQPSTLALLALGAGGVLALRQRRQAA